MKNVLVALMLVSLLSISALAANFVMTGDNAANQSSFNQGTNWAGGLAPSAGIPPATNDYFTNGYLMRSSVAAPGGAYLAGPQTFLGDSLTVGRGANPVGTAGYSSTPFPLDGSVNNNCILLKALGDFTITHLVLDGGGLRDGMGGGQLCSFSGNLSVTANGGYIGPQCILSINSTISGTGPIYINTNGNGAADRVVHFTSALSTYSGNIILNARANDTAAYSRLTLDDNSLMNFVIGVSGVNNKISGKGTLVANGDFKFDLTGASTNFGDSWQIVDNTATVVKSFGATFTAVGFTNTSITGDWRTTANGANYLFNTTTGTLKVVPEPATMMLLGLGSLALLRKKR